MCPKQANYKAMHVHKDRIDILRWLTCPNYGTAFEYIYSDQL